MPFMVQDENGELVQVPVRVSPSDDHKLFYANGATGGIYANYHYRIDFYQDIIPPVSYVDPEGDGRPGPGTVEHIDRKIVASVVLSLPFAKELKAWLDTSLREAEEKYGEIQLPKSNIPEEVQKTLAGFGK